jgi:hypothetical protein
MFKQLKAGLMKVFSKKWLVVVFCVILIGGLYSYSNRKHRFLDMMTTGLDSTVSNHDPALNNPSNLQSVVEKPKYEMQPVSNPNDLLPKDSNNQWASLNPITQGSVAIPDLLQSGYHIGLDSIGQSLKNANYQDRADPIIEVKPTGIWNQSTIEPDLARVSR